MPFELGLACGLQRAKPLHAHRFFIFEKKRNRIDYTTSDLKGIDPRIHGRTATGAISAVLDVLDSSQGQITTEDVLWVYRRLKRIVPGLKRRHRSSSLYRRAILNDLVEAALVIRSVSTNGNRRLAQ